MAGRHKLAFQICTAQETKIASHPLGIDVGQLWEQIIKEAIDLPNLFTPLVVEAICIG